MYDYIFLNSLAFCRQFSVFITHRLRYDLVEPLSSAAQMKEYSCVSHSMTHLVLGSGRPRHWTSERANSATINRRRHQSQLVRQEACERITARQPGPHTKCPDQPIAHDITHVHIHTPIDSPRRQSVWQCQRIRDSYGWWGCGNGGPVRLKFPVPSNWNRELALHA